MLSHQHGDVLLYAVAAIPAEAQEAKYDSRGIVLAEGEATGHAHTITDGDCALMELGERRFLRVKKTATLTHQEHKAQTIRPGTYEVKRVREVDPFSEEVHAVRD